MGKKRIHPDNANRAYHARREKNRHAAGPFGAYQKAGVVCLSIPKTSFSLTGLLSLQSIFFGENGYKTAKRLISRFSWCRHFMGEIDRKRRLIGVCYG